MQQLKLKNMYVGCGARARSRACQTWQRISRREIRITMRSTTERTNISNEILRNRREFNFSFEIITHFSNTLMFVEGLKLLDLEVVDFFIHLEESVLLDFSCCVLILNALYKPLPTFESFWTRKRMQRFNEN